MTPRPKNRLPEMSKGLVLLHSLGSGREGGGRGGGVVLSLLVLTGPLLFFFLRPQDVFSKGLVHLPRKGR